jgi:multidrug efflux pump subunit AcrB
VFEVADTQGEIIETSVSNLITALRDSVILTVVVIFLILARVRATPIMFVSGYSQKILRPLTVVLSLALLSSYVVSVTVIPLLAPKFMKSGHGASRPERVVEKITAFWLLPLQQFFVGCFRLSTGKWGWFLPFLMLGLLIVSLRQMPLAGQDLMPPMDTGIVKIDFEVWPNSPIAVTEQVVAEMEKHIMAAPGFVRMATVIGSEPGVISFGAERTPQEGLITVHFQNRFEREKSIWEIEADLRKTFSKMPGLKRTDGYDYGATPLSSIAAPIDVMISGPDPRLLNQLAADAEQRLFKVRGLTTLSRSWDWSKKEIAISIDEARLARYGLSPGDVSKYG